MSRGGKSRDLSRSVCPGELKADINQTLEAFEHILHLYRSGLHLDDLPPSEFTGNSLGDKGCSFFFKIPLCPFFFVGSAQLSASTSVFISYCKKKKKKKGAVFSARAVLTGLLGSWNERTRPTKD